MLSPHERPFFVGGQLSQVMGGKAVELRGATPEHLDGVTVSGQPTSSASANTKGGYTEIVSAANNTKDIYGFALMLPNASTNRDCLIDIAVGGAGSEVVVMGNILFSSIKSGRHGDHAVIPLFIARGQRIAARVQCSTGSTAQNVSMTPFHRNPWPRRYWTCETWGAATGDSGGTSIDPGGTANTEGAWTELTSSTTRRTRLFVIAIGNQNNTTRSDATWLVDLGVGAAGSEVAVAENMYFIVNQAIDFTCPCFHGPIPVDIPAGSRVSVRAQCSINTSPARLIDAVVYGFAP